MGKTREDALSSYEINGVGEDGGDGGGCELHDDRWICRVCDEGRWQVVSWILGLKMLGLPSMILGRSFIIY